MSCNFKGFFEKRKVSYYKILLLISVSRYYLQDAKIRYCPSLLIDMLLVKNHASIVKLSIAVPKHS